MKKLSPISLKNIKIEDSFWNRYTHLVPDVIIPYQWDILNDNIKDIETSHCIANFRIAAGYEKGEFQGAVFQDSDLAKWLEAVAYSLATQPEKKAFLATTSHCGSWRDTRMSTSLLLVVW